MKLRVLSLGAGVQSTALALMAAHGEIGPMPDFAVFADTGAEPAAVYEHLEWMRSGNVLPFPIEVVSQGNIRTDTEAVVRGEKIRGRGRAATAPFFTAGKDGVAAPLRRQCTGHYKIEPIDTLLRERLGIRPRQRQPKEPLVELWLGISTDEVYRVKPAQQDWLVRRWPLIEKRMSRGDCLEWIARNGYPTPPRSACTFCPFRSNEEWRALTPAEFAEAVAIDRVIRQGFPSTRGEVFLHRSLKPLDQVDLTTPEERGQGNLFLNECEGMCGN